MLHYYYCIIESTVDRHRKTWKYSNLFYTSCIIHDLHMRAIHSFIHFSFLSIHRLTESSGAIETVSLILIELAFISVLAVASSQALAAASASSRFFRSSGERNSSFDFFFHDKHSLDRQHLHNHSLRNIILRVKQILITERTEQLLLVFIKAGRSQALLALGALETLLVKWCAV